jgi:hypothetical protein
MEKCAVETRGPTRDDQVVFRLLQDGEGVLLHAETGAYHGVNATGAAIWERLDGLRDVGDIADELCQVFEDPPPGADLRRGVEVFVDALRARGLAH